MSDFKFKLSGHKLFNMNLFNNQSKKKLPLFFKKKTSFVILFL